MPAIDTAKRGVNSAGMNEVSRRAGNRKGIQISTCRYKVSGGRRKYRWNLGTSCSLLVMGWVGERWVGS